MDSAPLAKNVLGASGELAVVCPQTTWSFTVETQWRAVSSRFGAISDAEQSSNSVALRREPSTNTFESTVGKPWDKKMS